MDESALQGLKAAYQAAPSAELAKVIVATLVERHEFDEIEIYLEGLNASIDAALFDTLCHTLLTRDKTDALTMLITRTRSSARDEAIKASIQRMADKGEKDHAARLRAAAQKVDPAFAGEALNGKLDNADASTATKDQKPKLRVVEKVNFGEVTDLHRYAQATNSFKDVVGLEDIKKQINKKIILPFQKPSLFQRFKKKIGGGVMLYGPPGCGKTLLARATAGECKAAFYNVEISDVLDMYIGESEQKLHAIFEKARQKTPSVLFFDEMEALAGKREHTRNSASANVVSQFLTELDGFSQNNEGVLVLASTNVPWAIDPAFLRPGRFDRMFFVPPPDQSAREGILRHHMHDRPSDDDIDFNALAKRTTGFSGADLANLVEMAADEAIDDTLVSGAEVKITNKHFKLAVDAARATTTEWLTTARNYARYANDGGRYDDVLEFLKKHGK